MSGQASFAVGTLSGVFLLSGVAKVLQPGPFAAFLEAAIGRRPHVVAVARVLPLTELTIGVLLLAATYRIAVIAALILALLFVIGGAYAMTRGPAAGCGCFGYADSATSHLFTLIRAGAVLALGVVCIAFVSGTNPGSNPYDLALGIVAGASCGLASALLAQLVGFLRGPFVDLMTSSAGGIT